MELLLDLLMPGENHVMPVVTISLVLAGMIVLAALDVWRREVEDYATIALLGVAVVGVSLEGITPEQWLSAVLASTVTFMIYLALGQRGVMGGGDVKLSVVPAFVLSASNPVIGLWWIACAIVIQQVLFFINSRVQKSPAAIPHVPAMAVAAVVASFAFPAAF